VLKTNRSAVGTRPVMLGSFSLLPAICGAISGKITATLAGNLTVRRERTLRDEKRDCNKGAPDLQGALNHGVPPIGLEPWSLQMARMIWFGQSLSSPSSGRTLSLSMSPSRPRSFGSDAGIGRRSGHRKRASLFAVVGQEPPHGAKSGNPQNRTFVVPSLWRSTGWNFGNAEYVERVPMRGARRVPVWPLLSRITHVNLTSFA